MLPWETSGASFKFLWHGIICSPRIYVSSLALLNKGGKFLILFYSVDSHIFPLTLRDIWNNYMIEILWLLDIPPSAVVLHIHPFCQNRGVEYQLVLRWVIFYFGHGNFWRGEWNAPDKFMDVKKYFRMVECNSGQLCIFYLKNLIVFEKSLL